MLISDWSSDVCSSDLELAREAPVEADVIVPVPDSGVPSAIGYAAEAGIPFEIGITRNHYVGRTFIEPTEEIRHLERNSVVEGKDVAVRYVFGGRRMQKTKKEHRTSI